MTDHDRDTLQMRRIVEADHPAASTPDVPGLLDAGHRRLRRRRIATGGAALAVVAALAVPAYVVGGGLSGGSDGASDTAAAPAVPTSDDQCGVLVCVEGKEQPRERDEVVGGPWVVGELADGTEEVIYTVRTDGFDLETGDPVSDLEVLSVGYRRDGVLHTVAKTVQPGHDGRSPAGRDVTMWSNLGRITEARGDHLLVVGYVDGTPDEITWSVDDTGETGSVDAMDTTVVPGRTVFYATVPLPEGFERTQPTYEKKGDEYLIIEGNEEATFPPDVTFRTSDGWSCSLQDCGSIG